MYVSKRVAGGCFIILSQSPRQCNNGEEGITARLSLVQWHSS